MSRLRPYPVLVLAVWSLVVWTGRLGLAWKTAGTTGGKVLATVPVALFVALGAALVAVLVRRPVEEARAGVLTGTRRPFVLAAAGWTVAYWLVRLPFILTDGRSVPFKGIHVVLAAVSVGLSLSVWRALRHPVDESRTSVRYSEGVVPGP